MLKLGMLKIIYQKGYLLDKIIIMNVTFEKLLNFEIKKEVKR